MVKINRLVSIVLLLLLSGIVLAGEHSSVDVVLSQVSVDHGKYVLFNVTIINRGDEKIFVDRLLFNGSGISGGEVDPVFSYIGGEKSETVLLWMKVPIKQDLNLNVIYHLDECRVDECKKVETSNTVGVYVSMQHTFRAYLLFLCFGYMSLALFLICLFARSLENYMIKLFALLLAISNLSTAMLGFLFNLHEGSFLVFVLISVFTMGISVWLEKIPERYFDGIPKDSFKKEYLQEKIRANYTKWNSYWFLFIFFELAIAIFYGLVKPSIAASCSAFVLLFIVSSLHLKRIRGGRGFVLVAFFIIILFGMNQITSPIFEPRVSVIDVSPRYYVCNQGVSGCYEIGGIDLQVEPSVLGFLPYLSNNPRIFNQAVLSLPDNYFIRNYAVEYPCGIRTLGETDEGVLIGVDTYFAKNAACVFYISYEKEIDAGTMNIDTIRIHEEYIDSSNNSWICDTLNVRNKEDLKIREFRHTGPIGGEVLCLVDNKKVGCGYAPLQRKYYVSSQIESGEETALSVCTGK